MISHVISETPSPEKTLPPPAEAAYAIHLHHRPLSLGETWIGGKHALMPSIGVGHICMFDLEGSPVARVLEKLEFTRFGISQMTLQDLAYERGQSGVVRLRIPELGRPDPVIENLALTVMSRSRFFEHETDSLFIDWIGLAFCAHLVDAYGEARPAGVGRCGIAPWRLRQACDLMLERLDSPLSITDIAKEVGMTPEYFARAFRQATGEPPHRWLLRKRLERAKELLRKPDGSLAEISAACGFFDQSHLTRVFGKIEGISPGRWRRQMRD